MITHNLIQGSDEWAQFRVAHCGASEAAAMLGISSKVKRTELLHMKHTGNPKEYSAWVQENILDHGHVVEALARPIIEEMIGEDLYPVTCSDGPYSASCDGLTLSEEIAFEHKQWNEQLAASVAAKVLPDEYQPQCQQVLMVTGAKKVLFTVSDGTANNMVTMDVLPDAVWFDRLRAGWAQFEKDLASYQPREIVEKPQANAIISLPALSVQIRGEVILSNLPEFQAAAKTFVANIKTDLQTDDDFANAEAIVKFCDKAEKDLELTKRAALAQTASIDELLRTIDFIKDELRAKRLMLDKLVSSKKIEIKEKILKDARTAFADHLAGLEAEIKPIRMLCASPDFVGAAKNKRTLASLHDAVDSVLANAKIAADATAKDIRAKLAWCKEHAEGYGFLFSDLQLLVQKPVDDFQLLVNSRITEHKKAEAEKVEAALEREREAERVRLEKEAERVRLIAEAEAAKLRAEQEAKLAAERLAIAAPPEPAVMEAATATVTPPIEAQQAPIKAPRQEPAIAQAKPDRETAFQDAQCANPEDALRWILLICKRCTDGDIQLAEAIAQIALIAGANLPYRASMPLPKRSDKAVHPTRT